MKLIRYDAWRYGGEALPRNFIAHAARELHLPLEDSRYAEFHRGLYENKRRISLSPPQMRAALASGPFLPLLVLAVVIGLTGWLLSLDSVLIGGLVSTFLLILTALIDSGKVQIEQSRPSEDEEFSRRFERVRHLPGDPPDPRRGRRARRARRRRSHLLGAFADSLGLYRLRLWWSPQVFACRLEPPVVERLIFFIDELDRCDAKDIVLTLKALRTFLDAERCVFIVAADREAIEAALVEVEQWTPLDPERPYYATAGAYLDKIFQHQISLPPLRSRSLAKFARSLTVSSGGIWGELVDADSEPEQATPSLDLVLFTLIPSHVRSPRRVKVLLNNFATNVRMVRSRLPDVWPARAREIARLTTFQTEFAELAADLPLEPRLPRFLLDASEAPESEVVHELLRRWDLEPEEGEFEEDSVEAGPGDEEAHGESPDPLLAKEEERDGEGAAERRRRRDRLKRRRREELRRYLERTADVDDLRRDLFYLQPAGLDVGLQGNPELAEQIEVEATDSPETVIEALQEQDDRRALIGAARLLASMVDDVLGPEQRQVMSALMAAVELLGEDAREVSREVGDALRTYWTGRGELQERHLVGALQTALIVRESEPSKASLVPEVLGDERLWAAPDRVGAVIAMTEMLRDGVEIERLEEATADQLPGSPELLIDAIERLPVRQRLRLMSSDVIVVGLGRALDRADDTEENEEGAK